MINFKSLHKSRPSLVIAFSVLAASYSSTSMAGRLCVERAEVTKLFVGEVNGNMGTDGGNAIYAEFDNQTTIAANLKYNLDDEKGKGLLSILRTAFIMKAKVDVWDHHGDNCDDFDEVDIY
ncbi:hypothetical protein ONV78_30430 [Hahella sp. CR1]|uniref:hypothetical protein n=1 Tax=Hahella sp. CR1 TaxID=2992807 RepID=UPI002441AFA9|nr:hypothetical protein [Hahella sp. CR1]MDG9672090.1 hypothetical protein [Hahella sp. CR1]